MVLSEEIQFIFIGFFFFATSKISRVRFRLFVAWINPFVFSCCCFFLVQLILVLSVLFLMSVISLPLRLSMKSSSRFIDASTLFSMLVSPLPPPFLGTYGLSTPSLGCNTLCIVLSFLVLRYICWSSSLDHLVPCILRGGALVLNPLVRFLLRSLISSSLLFLLRYCI